MKKTLLSLSLLWLITAANSQDTTTVFGLKAGINYSIFSASVNSDASFKTGFHIGGFIRTPISRNAFFRPEIYYSRQGQKDDLGSGDETTTTVNYVNVPFLFEIGRKVSFQFGPQMGLLVSAREKGTIGSEDIDDDLKSVMRTVDVSAVLGIGFNPSQNFHLGVRYNIGLTDIYKGDEDANIPGLDFPDIKNRVFHFYVGYSF